MKVTYYYISYGIELETMEFVRITKMHGVYLEAKGNERRVALRSEYRNFFDNPQDAIAHHRAGLVQKVENHKKHVAYSEGQLSNFNKRFPVEGA